ncbi:5-oxoprolinase subunit PxpA [Sporolactobacillus sp. THM7-4]|nr:5-oxoprolinase subunit PxpA [Sporolactobacillus sp. THM7-4]
MQPVVDISSDLGEGFGRYKMANDEEMLEVVTSANIACGFHAGDPRTISDTVKAALKNHNGIGAHPGFPDRVGFGRRDMALSYEEVYTDVLYQIGAIFAFAQANGGKLQHVMAHGQLQNMAQKNQIYAEAISDAVKDFDDSLIVMAQPGKLLDISREKGLRTAVTIFADRAYHEDKTLVSRRESGAVISDPDKVVKRCLKMVIEHKVTSVTGKEITVHGDSLLLHGDTAGSLQLSKRIKSALLEHGVKVLPLGQWI